MDYTLSERTPVQRPTNIEVIRKWNPGFKSYPKEQSRGLDLLSPNYTTLLIHMSRILFTNRIYHRSPTEAEKSEPKGKRIMPETSFTEFPALSVDPRVGISRSASETDVWLFFNYL